MGTLVSGVGLISGIDIQSLVNQLIAVEGRPRDLLLTRIGNLDAQKTAYLDVSARIASLLGRVNSLSQRSFFRTAVASSSNADVLTATVNASSEPGSYSFVVRALASAHQLISAGFRGSDTALPSGTLTLESGRARVNRQTLLDELNGHAGVRRGAFKIYDGQGHEAVINVADARSIADVADRINTAGISVRASLRGEALVLTETTGGEVKVREVDGGHVAEDLGFDASHRNGTGELVGRDVMYLADGTLLAGLNDGLGVRTSKAGGDFTIYDSYGGRINVDLSGILKADTRLERLNHGAGVNRGTIRITTRTGTVKDVDLTGARDIAEVQTRIEAAFTETDADGNATKRVAVTITGDGLIIGDLKKPAKDELALEFKIEDVTGTAARDLGIAGKAKEDQVRGRDVLHMDTLEDALAAINHATGNEGQVVAAISSDGRRLVLTAEEGGTMGGLRLEAGANSQALFDLGFTPGEYEDYLATGVRIIGGVDTALLKTLNGGAGYAGGVIRIAADAGSVDVDLTGAETLRDAIELINTAAGALGVEAGYDATGTGLLIRNTDEGDRTITISDVTGNLAASLGLAQSGNRIRGVNLQRQYVAETTRLADLNNGLGVGLGKIKITNSKGLVSYVDLTQTRPETLQDVIDAINEDALSVTARINATGDGLLITDTAGGNLALKISDEFGNAARDLNIAGESDEATIDGSYEFRLELAGNETVSDLVARIDAETTLADASLFNDGTSLTPYRLSILSRASGRAGELIVDGSGLGLDFSTLSRPQDAAVLVGTDPNSGILITSATNTLSNVVNGLTLNLTSVDDQPVTVTVNRDVEALVTTLRGLVSDFNALMDRIDELGSYNAETEKRGVLLGEGTLHIIENRLFRLMTGSVAGAGGTITRLSQLGVQLGDGARLSFNEEQFRTKLGDDPEEVQRFFTAAGTGLGVAMKASLEAINGTGGLIDRREANLASQQDVLNDRVERLNELLERRRERLTRQFQAMERALAVLQGQQASLQTLSALASSSGSTGGSSLFG